MADTPLQVFVAAFDTERQAGAALEDFRTMDPDGSIELVDAVVIVREPTGRCGSRKRQMLAMRNGRNEEPSQGHWSA